MACQLLESTLVESDLMRSAEQSNKATSIMESSTNQRASTKLDILFHNVLKNKQPTMPYTKANKTITPAANSTKKTNSTATSTGKPRAQRIEQFRQQVNPKSTKRTARPRAPTPPITHTTTSTGASCTTTVFHEEEEEFFCGFEVEELETPTKIKEITSNVGDIGVPTMKTVDESTPVKTNNYLTMEDAQKVLDFARQTTDSSLWSWESEDLEAGVDSNATEGFANPPSLEGKSAEELQAIATEKGRTRESIYRIAKFWRIPLQESLELVASVESQQSPQTRRKRFLLSALKRPRKTTSLKKSTKANNKQEEKDEVKKHHTWSGRVLRKFHKKEANSERFSA